MANIIQSFPKGSGGGQSIQYDSMPTASSSLEGRIVQYTGVTDTDYTNGWFYECIEDTTTTPSSYEWVRVELSDLMPASDMSEVVDHYPAIGPTPGGSGGYDNVIEGYYNYSDSLFYYDSAFTLPVDGENRVIYLSLDTNIIYRYDGSIFIPLATVSDIQVVSLPTAGASHENEIYQYIGASDSTYTNGWFYKCIKDTTTTPVSYSWEKVEMIEYMPAEDMEEIIVSHPGVRSIYPVDYSTDEQLVGKWYDGSNIYQKTFVGTTNGSKSTDDIVATITGFNTLVNSVATMDFAGDWGVGQYHIPYNSVVEYYIDTSNRLILHKQNEIATNKKYYITLQYTKTT